jgi:hypothetical protein
VERALDVTLALSDEALDSLKLPATVFERACVAALKAGAEPRKHGSR